MSRILKCLAVVLLMGLMGLAGCDSQDKVPTVQVQQKPQKRQTRVVVPASVQGKWKAVKIAVENKDSGTQKVYQVSIGSSFTLDKGDLKLDVLNFLPDFQMDGSVLTSVSNKPNNPAAQIVISESGQEVFRGWLFSRYPSAHAFQHPHYGFSLVDFVPAK